MTQKVLFSGSRDATPDMLIATRQYIVDTLEGRDVEVICGDATGVDYVVIQACDEIGIPIQVHGAYGRMRYTTWTGKNIPHEGIDYLARDRIMADLIGPTDRAVIVWNGKSKQCGTVATARAVSRNTFLVYWLWMKWEQ